jgi:hypothetical protein
MSIETLTPREKAVIRRALQQLNHKYGSGGVIIKFNWNRQTVNIRGGKTPERPFTLGHGAREGTFRLKFAGQQAVTKPIPVGIRVRV